MTEPVKVTRVCRHDPLERACAFCFDALEQAQAEVTAKLAKTEAKLKIFDDWDNSPDDCLVAGHVLLVEERDALKAQAAWTTVQEERLAFLIERTNTLTAERDVSRAQVAALTADNAMLVGAAKEYLGNSRLTADNLQQNIRGEYRQRLVDAVNQPHPGTALLGEMKALKERVAMFEKAQAAMQGEAKPAVAKWRTHG